MDPVWALALFAGLGLVVGAYGTLIGAGGGFVVVPVLLLGLHWTHDKAVGTSLVVVACNAASGSFAYWRQGRVDFRTGLPFAAATIPGAIAGSTLVQMMSGRVFNIAFGVLLILVSLYLIARPPRTSTPRTERPAGLLGFGWSVRHLVDKSGTEYNYGFSMPLGLLLSFGVGFLSSILGIGGGIVHVPALVTLFQFPAHVATATSHFILAISAATGAVTHATLGNVEVGPALSMGAGAVVGAQVGGALSHRVHATWILRALAAALGLVGVRLLIG